MNKVIKLSAVFASLAAISPVGHSLVIDGFDDAQQVFSMSQTVPDTSALATGNAIGGERDIAAQVVAGSSGSNVMVDSGVSNVFVPTDDRTFLSHTQGNNTGFSQVVWDGVDNDAFGLDFTGLGGIDLQAGGDNSFRLELVTVDQGIVMPPFTQPAQIHLFVFSSATSWSFASFTPEEQGLFDPVSAEVFVPYASFSQGPQAIPQLTNIANNTTFPVPQITNDALTSADFSNVGSIMMLIDGTLTPQFDFGIDVLETTEVVLPVSVPASAWLVALITFVAYLKRRRLLAKS